MIPGSSARDLADAGSLSKANGSGGESFSLRIRGGVGDKASRASSSESSISSMSMKRPDPFGGVDGGWCGVCRGGDGLHNGSDAVAGTVGIALCDFGG